MRWNVDGSPALDSRIRQIEPSRPRASRSSREPVVPSTVGEPLVPSSLM
jgi:hypothetical protein